jgi:hypothetical protein
MASRDRCPKSTARAEIPKITGQRLGSASVTRGNVAGSHSFVEVIANGTALVYKVDRLTRSLADFAKIVDVLGATPNSARSSC